MTRIENGFVWPERDIHCHRAVFRSLDDLDLAMSLCKDRRTAIQAGGNCGVWPARMAETFNRVVTFEPDAENYGCLVQNVPDNVDAHRAALGQAPGKVGLQRDPRNCGAYQVEDLGHIPMVRIDDVVREFDVRNVDLICLDIEGYEIPALMGASLTLAEFHPVIQIEDKGLSDRYGYPKGAAEVWLAENFGYEVRHRVNRDVILT